MGFRVTPLHETVRTFCLSEADIVQIPPRIELQIRSDRHPPAMPPSLLHRISVTLSMEGGWEALTQLSASPAASSL